MATEIERKYRVLDIEPDFELPRGIDIDQGYLNDGNPTCRVRTYGKKAYLTIKGKSSSTATGALERKEFEYEIPAEDARELLDMALFRLQKTRYKLAGGIELDIFKGRHEGLIVAEYESRDGDQAAPPPGIRWKEVSTDSRYSNSSIARFGVPEDTA